MKVEFYFKLDKPKIAFFTILFAIAFIIMMVALAPEVLAIMWIVGMCVFFLLYFGKHVMSCYNE